MSYTLDLHANYAVEYNIIVSADSSRHYINGPYERTVAWKLVAEMLKSEPNRNYYVQSYVQITGNDKGTLVLNMGGKIISPAERWPLWRAPAVARANPWSVPAQAKEIYDQIAHVWRCWLFEQWKPGHTLYRYHSPVHWGNDIEQGQRYLWAASSYELARIMAASAATAQIPYAEQLSGIGWIKVDWSSEQSV